MAKHCEYSQQLKHLKEKQKDDDILDICMGVLDGMDGATKDDYIKEIKEIKAHQIARKGVFAYSLQSVEKAQLLLDFFDRLKHGSSSNYV